MKTISKSPTFLWRNLPLFVLSLFTAFACGDDDSTPNNPSTPDTGAANVRIVSVDPTEDSFTFKNFGESEVDITSYRLCSKFVYTESALSNLTLTSGSLKLAAGASVTLSGWPVDDTSADLALYLAEGSFSDADALVDFVQWGSAGNGRESLAASKGIWTAGDFITGVAPFSYTGNGNQTGVSFWASGDIVVDPDPTRDIRIVRVDPKKDIYEFQNFGDGGVDISKYRLCTKKTYAGGVLDQLTIELGGDLTLDPGEKVTLSGWPINDEAADLALYFEVGSFGDPDAMVDFVQWGSAGNGRETEAETAGIWTIGDFVDNKGASFVYEGDGTENGVSFWKIETDVDPGLARPVRIIAVNPASDSYTFKNFGESTIDISGYRLCTKITYSGGTLSNILADKESLSLAPGATVTLSGWPIDDTAADLALYKATGSFGDFTAMADFVQWGSAGNGRESEADQAGIWTKGDFVDHEGKSFVYEGDGTEGGLSFWKVED